MELRFCTQSIYIVGQPNASSLLQQQQTVPCTQAVKGPSLISKGHVTNDPIVVDVTLVVITGASKLPFYHIMKSLQLISKIKYTNLSSPNLWEGTSIIILTMATHTRDMSCYINMYCITSNIRCTKSQNSNVSLLILQLSLPEPLKPGFQLIMKM